MEYEKLVWDAFRRINARPNHVVQMRFFRFGVMHSMNPVEQDEFINAIIGMVDAGYLTYEKGQDLLRLTKKGYDVLYSCRPDDVIADALLDMFRKSNCRVGDIIPMRNINMQFIPSLNPKEQDRFEDIANKLIDEELILFDNGVIPCLKLKARGYDYIYKQSIDIKTFFK